MRKLGRRAAILDLDIHHGNGTQDIFLGDDDALYVSLHQVPHYPGTGLRPEGNCLNFPLPPGTDEGAYMKTLGRALESIAHYKPEVLAVSMGFDTYAGDPLGGMRITAGGYGKIGAMVKGLDLPTFVVLEGGYSGSIGELCLGFLEGF